MQPLGHHAQLRPFSVASTPGKSVPAGFRTTLRPPMGNPDACEAYERAIELSGDTAETA